MRVITVLCKKNNVFFLRRDSWRGSGPPHYRGFTIALI